MDSKQIKLNSLNQLIPILSEFPEVQEDGIDEKAILKAEIQKDCKHESFSNHGDIEICDNCNLRKLT